MAELRQLLRCQPTILSTRSQGCISRLLPSGRGPCRDRIRVVLSSRFFQELEERRQTRWETPEGSGALNYTVENAPSADPSAEQVDDIFYKRLSNILRIVIPGIKSKEALLLCMHSSLLIFRTAISLYVASLDGK